jgi:TM2 domain-containing membrane protein YozV
MAGESSGKRVVAAILAILLGGLGVHKFYLGMTTPGIILLAITLVSCGTLWPVTAIIGLVEGIMYLTKSDEEFDKLYVTGPDKKQWF